MFRIDDNEVIDATMCGGPARYVNHSCNPNCMAEVVSIGEENKIIIIAKRRISRGEEVCILVFCSDSSPFCGPLVTPVLSVGFKAKVDS